MEEFWIFERIFAESPPGILLLKIFLVKLLLSRGIIGHGVRVTDTEGFWSKFLRILNKMSDDFAANLSRFCMKSWEFYSKATQVQCLKYLSILREISKQLVLVAYQEILIEIPEGTPNGIPGGTPRALFEGTLRVISGRTFYLLGFFNVIFCPELDHLG